MDPQHFHRGAETNQLLADYLDEISQTSLPTERDRSLGLDLLFVVASYAVYLWARNFIDHKRGLNEAELRRQMEQEIDQLVKSGYSREEALSAVLAVSKAVAARPPDDAVLAAGLSLLKGGR